VKTFALVYQNGIANVFDVTPTRCQKCQDVTGKDGLGRRCKGCQGRGQLKTAPRRVLQHSFCVCEAFIAGLRCAGAFVLLHHCDRKGDVAKCQSKWQRGPGTMFQEEKNKVAGLEGTWCRNDIV
jgi:hypothetical protein